MDGWRFSSSPAGSGGWAGTGGPRRIRVRWHLASPGLRLAGQGAAVAALAVAAFTFLSIGDRIDETAASVLVAVVFGVATVLQLRQSQRRQHTLELITGFQHAEALSAADIWMATRITEHRPVGVDIPVEDARYVITMLDYYEFLASLALRGLVDVPLLLGLRGGTMTRCYEICRGYVEDRRANVGAELYRRLEVFVAEYSRRAGTGRTPTPEPAVPADA